MKRIIAILLLAANQLNAQTPSVPLHVLDMTRPNTIPFSSLPTPFGNSTWNISQNIFTYNDFPSMPLQGQITDLYLKLGYNTPAGSKIHGFKVKMGHTNFHTHYWFGANPIDSFCAMDAVMDTVYYDSLYTLAATVPAGGWWHIPLKKPFHYAFQLPGDVSQNLVVQLSTDSLQKEHRTYLFNINSFARTVPYSFGLKTAVGQKKGASPPCIDYFNASGYAWDIGFNPNPNPPTGINEIGVQSVSLYPNPTTDKISLNSYSGVYTIYNLMGIKIAEGNFNKGENISVRDLQIGVYLMRIEGRVLKFMKE